MRCVFILILLGFYFNAHAQLDRIASNGIKNKKNIKSKKINKKRNLKNKAISFQNNALYEHLANCPICLDNKNVVKIVYGKPGPELQLKAQRKEVYLRGCSPDSLRFHCWKHDINFVK